MRPLFARFAVVLLTVAPLAIGGKWMYDASNAAFDQQHDIRIAQNTRSELVRIHLVEEVDVRGYAATDDPYFVNHFNAGKHSFPDTARRLAKELWAIDHSFDGKPIRDELTLYARWQAKVVNPIFSQRRHTHEHLLRVTDPGFTRAFIEKDRSIEDFLDNAISTSESHRQRFLRHVLFASIALVLTAAVFVGVLLWFGELAERRRLVHASQYEEERRIAKMLQSTLVPVLPALLDGVRFRAVYVPAASENLVGGDWYEALRIAPGQVLFAVGDVAGHGLDAAVGMNRARQSILTAAVTQHDPARVLELANTAVFAQSDRMVTVLCGVYDTRTRRFAYATAGHPPPVIVTPQSQPYFLDAGGPPLGIDANVQLETMSCVLAPGTTIFVFTDGLLEQTHDVLAGSLRILDAACAAAASEHPAQALYDAVIAGADVRDDVAVLAVTLPA